MRKNGHVTTNLWTGTTDLFEFYWTMCECFDSCFKQHALHTKRKNV